MHCSRVDAFRHRAVLIIADHAAVSHACSILTLTGGGEAQGVPRHEGHSPGIVPDIEMRA